LDAADVVSLSLLRSRAKYAGTIVSRSLRYWKEKLMAGRDPKVILRLGTHAEKEYFEKLGARFDGLMVGANLVESTPGATASLIVRLCGKPKSLEYYIDPMTYAFGTYVDPLDGETRDDLDWIKSDQKVKGRTKPVRKFKRSYLKLASRFGEPFEGALESSRALTPSDLDDTRTVRRVCEAVVSYQLRRIRDEFENDEEYREFAAAVPAPSAVIAPYFYIEPSASDEWMGVNVAMAAGAVRLSADVPVHALVCAPRDLLVDENFREWVSDELGTSGVQGVWLWFSKFDEYTAKTSELRALRDLVTALSEKGLTVLNLHGGFFSLSLSNFGLGGISHGVGYGEQKDVVPVIGQSTPTVRYYLPALRRRLSHLDIERCFRTLKIRNVPSFHELICDCTICKGVLRDGLDKFAEFGEKRLSTPESKREAQTPAAAKRCRFHFLLNRSKERDWISSVGLEDVVERLNEDVTLWEKTPLSESTAQLQKWAEVLSE
jgi:hypothetical protein